MISFSSLGGSTVKGEINDVTFVAFPDSPDAGVKVSLLANPEKVEEVTSGAISWPGEYDVGGVAIRGIGHDDGQRVSYAIDDGKVRIAFIASPLHDWSDYEMELLGDIDVLCLPADDAKLAQKMIDEVDPRILIPLPTSDVAIYTEILKAAGAQDKEPEAEFKQKGALPAEGREVVILKPTK